LNALSGEWKCAAIASSEFADPVTGESKAP
jgi:hypothetical protein